jgi:hypothetical protein
VLHWSVLTPVAVQALNPASPEPKAKAMHALPDAQPASFAQVSRQLAQFSIVTHWA